MWENHSSVASQVLPKWDTACIPGMCQWTSGSQGKAHYAEPHQLGQENPLLIIYDVTSFKVAFKNIIHN